MDKFWQRVDRREDSACWPWLGGKHRSGYGQFKHDGGAYKAHRVAYALSKGGLTWGTGERGARGVIVRHSCDNRGCCNPAHLLAGTQRDNVGDAVARKRMAHGATHHRAKLTPEKVAQIKAMAKAGLLGSGRGRGWHRLDGVLISYRQVGEMFGVNGKTIEQVLRGRSWVGIGES